MKATNYQKQTLKMYEMRFKEDITFSRAEKIIKKKELELKEEYDKRLIDIRMGCLCGHFDYCTHSR